MGFEIVGHCESLRTSVVLCFFFLYKKALLFLSSLWKKLKKKHYWLFSDSSLTFVFMDFYDKNVTHSF